MRPRAKQHKGDDSRGNGGTDRQAHSQSQIGGRGAKDDAQNCPEENSPPGNLGEIGVRGNVRLKRGRRSKFLFCRGQEAFLFKSYKPTAIRWRRGKFYSSYNCWRFASW